MLLDRDDGCQTRGWRHLEALCEVWVLLVLVAVLWVLFYILCFNRGLFCGDIMRKPVWVSDGQAGRLAGGGEGAPTLLGGFNPRMFAACFSGSVTPSAGRRDPSAWNHVPVLVVVSRG